MNKCLIRKEKSGISTSLSFIALAIIILVIGSIVAYFYIYHLKTTTQVVTSELAKQETRLLEKISLIYWGGGTAILSNDGEISISIKKIYVDNNIIPINPSIVINPHEKKEIPIPSGQSLMVETSSGNLIKLVEKGFTITGTTWTTNLPSEITYTSYIPTTITTTQTSIFPTTITTTIPITYTTTRSTTQTLTSYIPTIYTTTFTTITPTTITTTTPITYTTTIPTTITQTLTTTTPTTITQTLSTTQTITSYIPTTYTTTYATTGTKTITTTIPITITTTKSTTQTITSYIPTTLTSTITTTKPTTITQTQTITKTTTRTVIRTTITSSYQTTTVIPYSTAYFRGDTWTINGLNAYKLSSPQSDIEKSNRVESATSTSASFGIRVWKRSSSGVETEITSGSPVATISVYKNTGYCYASWSHSAISLNPSDSIVVRVYGKVSAGYGDTNWKLLATFSTSQLGINSFPSSTWTVYYYIRFAYEYDRHSGFDYWYRYYFHWGTTSKNSRIENFAPSLTITQTYTTSTTITTITDYLGSIFIGENSPTFLITLCIIVVSITIEIRGRIKNGKQK